MASQKPVEDSSFTHASDFITPTQIEEGLEVTLRWMWKNDFFHCEFRFLSAKLQLLLQDDVFTAR